MIKKLVLIIGGVLILIQIFLFSEYLFSFKPNKILIKGQRCTCPHARVVKGQEYLKSITSDSLLKYNLNYSELFFENEISSTSDPMGVGEYEIIGEVIGKKSVIDGSSKFYPLIRVNSYNEVGPKNILSWFLRVMLIVEIVIMIFLFKKQQNHKK